MQVKQALCASAAVMLVMAGGAGAIAADRPAQAQAAGRQMRLSLPQQALGQSLKDVARRFDRTIIFRPELVQGRQAPRLDGAYTVSQALDAVLAGSGLAADLSDPRSILVSPAAKAAEAAARHAAARGTADDEQELAELVVTGRRDADRKALAAKKRADNFVEALYADDVGKLPDQNIAEAVRRLPGVSAANDQGEGRYVLIRGVDPNLANVTMNGQTAPAPEPAGRQVKLDDVPSALIGSVKVVKTLTPDLDANAIAGEVEIKTLSAFDRRTPFVNARAAYGYYDLNGKNPYEGDVTAGTRFGGQDQFGAVLALNYSKRPIQSQNVQGSSNWAPVNGRVVPDDFRLRDYNLTRERSGVVANLDWRPSDRTSLYLRAVYDTFSDSEVRDQFRFALPVKTASAFSNQTATTGAFTGGVATRYVRNRKEEDATRNLTVGGRFELPRGELSAEAGYANAVKEDPRRDEWQFSGPKAGFAGTYDLGSTLFLVSPADAAYDPSKFTAKSISHAHRRAEETVWQGRVDYSLPLAGVGERTTLKVGAKLLDRHKTNDQESATYNYSGSTLTLAAASFLGEPSIYGGRYRFGPRVDTAAAEAFFSANPSQFKLDPKSIGDSLSSDYDVSERIYAAYVMAEAHVGRLTVIPGVRVERTEGDYKAKLVTAATAADPGFNLRGERDYTNLFPGVNLRFDVNDRLVLRAAATTAIGRPNYADLAPYVTIDTAAGTVSMGNPGLKPLKAANLDAAVEYYLPFQGLLSAGVFYKRIDDPIYSQQRIVQNGVFAGQTLAQAVVTSPTNADHAEVMGLELNAQAQLGFLPSPFDGLGVSANMTFIDSKATGVPGRTDSAPLANTSKRVASAQLFYEKYGFSARLAYSYRSHFLDTIGANRDLDVYTADFGQLDAQASYAVTSRLQVFVEGSNLNNEPWRRWIGDQRRLVENEQYGWALRGGVQLKF